MLSFGLVYIPGAYAGTDELVAVAEEAAAFGAPLVPHVRNEGAGVLEAVGELIDVARRAGAPLHLSHLKSLAPELDRAAARADRRGERRPRRDLRPVPVRRRLRRCSRACCPAGRRRAAPRRRSRAPPTRRSASGSPATSSEGLPGWENLLGTLGPERIIVGGAHARRARRRPQPGRHGLRPAASSRSSRCRWCSTTPPTRRCARSRATACSSSAPTASSATTRTRASTARRRASSAASRSARACSRSRRPSPG